MLKIWSNWTTTILCIPMGGQLFLIMKMRFDVTFCCIPRRFKDGEILLIFWTALFGGLLLDRLRIALVASRLISSVERITVVHIITLSILMNLITIIITYGANRPLIFVIIMINWKIIIGGHTNEMFILCKQIHIKIIVVVKHISTQLNPESTFGSMYQQFQIQDVFLFKK